MHRRGRAPLLRGRARIGACHHDRDRRAEFDRTRLLASPAERSARAPGWRRHPRSLERHARRSRSTPSAGPSPSRRDDRDRRGLVLVARRFDSNPGLDVARSNTQRLAGSRRRAVVLVGRSVWSCWRRKHRPRISDRTSAFFSRSHVTRSQLDARLGFDAARREALRSQARRPRSRSQTHRDGSARRRSATRVVDECSRSFP
jgi:hypothetical protein